MRHLSDISFIEEIFILNDTDNKLAFKTDNKEVFKTGMCCYNERIESIMDTVNYNFTTILILIVFNHALFILIIVFIYRLVNKKAVVYRDDDYQTTININHII